MYAQDHNYTAPQNEPPKLSAQPTEALKQLLKSIHSLSAYYEHENAALKNGKAQQFMDMQTKKVQLAHHYKSLIRQAGERADDLKKAPESLRNKVKEAQNQFNTLAEKNMEALERMSRCTERLNTRMMNIVREEVEKRRINSYSNSGALLSNKAPVSTTLHETV